MKSKIFLIAYSILFILIVLSMVSSAMPLTHDYLWATSTAEPIDSEFYTACMNYPDLCLAGNIMNDVTVIFYYTARGKYGVSHSPPFAKELIDNIAKIPNTDSEQMRACAIAGAMHQAQDLPFHSNLNGDGLVTYAIKHSKIINEIIHVFAEQHMDNWLSSKDPYRKQDMKTRLVAGYKICQPLFVTAMLGDTQFAGLTEADLNEVFDTFVTEIVNSHTGYDTGFKNKSMFVTIKSIPLIILIPYILIMLSFLLISILLIFKIIKRQSMIRHWIGLIIFIPLFLIMAYLFYGALNGSAFNSFVSLISPISNLVPIGNPQNYVDQAVKNTQELLKEGPSWLDGTDASGRGTNPILDQASKSVLVFDYVLLAVIILSMLWFIWYLFKKNKVISKGGFSL